MDTSLHPALKLSTQPTPLQVRSRGISLFFFHQALKLSTQSTPLQVRIHPSPHTTSLKLSTQPNTMHCRSELHTWIPLLSLLHCYILYLNCCIFPLQKTVRRRTLFSLSPQLLQSVPLLQYFSITENGEGEDPLQSESWGELSFLARTCVQAGPGTYK